MRQTISLILGRASDEVTERNFKQVQKAFSDISEVARGRITNDVTLAVGTNLVPLPQGVRNPAGRLTVYQSAAADLYDGGLSGDNWVIVSSAIATCRFMFF